MAVSTAHAGSSRGLVARRRLPFALAVAATVAFCLFPVYWLVNTSFKTGVDLRSADLVPSDPTIGNYAEVLGDGQFQRALLNSVIVSAATTLLALLLGAGSAYALARLRFRGKLVIGIVILSITTFPGIAISAPLFTLWIDLGLYDTLWGLIAANLTFALPLAVFVLAAFLAEIPAEVEEAALVDGASRVRILRSIVLPLAAPGLATAAILIFINVWNEFLFAITLTSSPDARTVPAAIAFFTGATEYEQPLGTISAASVLISVPLVAIVLVFQRRIVNGLTAGAVKG
jgi:multiple sugar transport system permease protein